MRFKSGFCLALGLAFLTVAGICGVLTVRQAAEISAYHHASTCPPGAPIVGDCLQSIDGAVTAVIEIGGKGAKYALDVRTAAGTRHITFSFDSLMLRDVIDGDPAVVTMWRGTPVAVSAGGRTEATANVPETAFARYLGEWALTAGGGLLLLLGAAATRRNRASGGQPFARPVVAAVTLALWLGCGVVTYSGAILAIDPSALHPDLAAAGAGLVIVAGLSAGLAITVIRRRNRRLPAGLGVRLPALRKNARTRMARRARPARARLHPATWAPVWETGAARWVMPALTVPVLFGVFFTTHDGPEARAFRHAPACVGESNLATCVGNFTATVNGVRTPLQGTANYAQVSYVTGDGVIRAWARFDGNGGALGRLAGADQNERAPVTIEVWRG